MFINIDVDLSQVTLTIINKDTVTFAQTFQRYNVLVADYIITPWEQELNTTTYVIILNPYFQSNGLKRICK